ncbi:MAG TPA: DUF4878 domain-containing protein [Pyrinomonadaceae bacterium]|nr:DUF4878 domain-containing protein [Pyrinomonadaceae bacterium]
MTRPTRSLTSITIVSILLLCGCGFKKSPSDIVKATYMAANSGQYSEVEKHLSNEALRTINGPQGSSSGGLKGIFDKKTRNGNIEKIEVEREFIKDDQAVVNIMLHLKDGRRAEDAVILIKEGGEWKLDRNIL